MADLGQVRGEMTKTVAYKVFTHRLCSPIQGGEPVWNGELPYELPTREVDESENECGAGWNACIDPVHALAIAGMWPDGFPSRMYQMETTAKTFSRKEKIRASTWTITEEINVREIIRKMSTCFEPFANEMACEQIAWYEALARPHDSEKAVIDNLRSALIMRGLAHWHLKKFDYPEPREAREAREAWGAWAAREAWAAWAAREALILFFAAKKGWVDKSPNLLTAGLRDAYTNGLGAVIPITKDTLGYCMLER
jgi:hypothetical protein